MKLYIFGGFAAFSKKTTFYINCKTMFDGIKQNNNDRSALDVCVKINLREM